MRQRDLWDAPLVRNTDSQYAHDAAAGITLKIGKIQAAVIASYRFRGDMSSKTAEALPEFSRYGRSTVQKRISELYLVGILELVPGAPEATYHLVEERIHDPLTSVPTKCPTCGHVTRMMV